MINVAKVVSEAIEWWRTRSAWTPGELSKPKWEYEVTCGGWDGLRIPPRPTPPDDDPTWELVAATEGSGTVGFYWKRQIADDEVGVQTKDGA